MSELFYGVPNVYLIWHGQWADPEILYDGKLYNYYDIEDYLYLTWQEENSDVPFVVWVQQNEEKVYSALEVMTCLT